MTVSLDAHFKAARLALGLSLEGLAGLTCTGNPRKVAGKIAAFERGGAINDELLARLGDALAVEYATVDRLMAHDRPEARFVIQRKNGDFLTPDFLQWSGTMTDAQRCEQDEAEAIRGWLDGFGIKTTVVALT